MKLESIPIEKRDAVRIAKKITAVLDFVGEKELSDNRELAVHKNALILKIKLDKLAPYLQGIEFGGVRILKDTKDGSGENFLAIDLDGALEKDNP